MQASIDNKFQQVASKRDVQRFERMMLDFAKFEHIQKLKDTVEPRIKVFTELIDKYEKDNE